jgi:hypothetical protein
MASRGGSPAKKADREAGQTGGGGSMGIAVAVGYEGRD